MSNRWTLITETDRYGFNGALGDSYPSFSAGESTTITLFSFLPSVKTYNYAKELTNYLNDSSTNTGTDIRGDPWYHESHSPRADYNSTLVKLEPGSGLNLIDNWWVLITDVELETSAIGVAPRFHIEVFCVAHGDEYENRQDVVDEFDTGELAK